LGLFKLDTKKEHHNNNNGQLLNTYNYLHADEIVRILFIQVKGKNS